MNRHPYVVCPDSGNTYDARLCTSAHRCGCGCGRNLADLLHEQMPAIRKVTMYQNRTPTGGRQHEP